MNQPATPGPSFQALFDASPNPYLVLDLRLHIVGANRAYLASVKRNLDDIVGRWAWDAFPTDPETLKQAIASFERVIATGQPDTMALLRFDVPRPEAEGGGMEERHWSISHAPVFDATGAVTAVLQHPIDVTELQHLRDAVQLREDLPAVDLKPAHTGIFSRAQGVHERNVVLQAEGARLRALFEQAPGFMAILRGPEHRFESANPAYLRTVGGRAVVGRTVREAFPDLEGQPFFGILDRVYASGKAYIGRGVEVRFEAPLDGSSERRFLDFVYQPIRDEAGRVTGIFVEGSDVTEAKLATDELRGRDARLRALVAASSEVLYSMSADWSEMRQLSGGTFLSDTATANANWIEDYIPAEEHERVSAAIGEAVRTGGTFHLEHRVRRSDGGVGWTLSRAVPLLDEAGQIYEWIGTAADVTGRREAEERLRELNDTLEQEVEERTSELNLLWRTSPDLLLVIDAAGVFRRVNPAWTTLLGYEPSELVGYYVNEFVAPDDHARTVEAYVEASEGGAPRIVNRYRHKDGSLRWISWVAARAGEVTYATGRDITAERERAEALKLTEEALRQSQKMEAVGQLTGGVAHDFNNLLTIIRSSIDFLRRPDLPEARKRRYLDAVSDTVDRAAKLTGQLLAFARRQTLSPEVFEVGAKVRGVADMVDTLTGSRVHVVTSVPDEPRFVRADANQFETALINMAVNARDAMDGEGTLTLRLEGSRGLPAIRGHGGSEAAFVAVSLTDTGTGISPGDINRIFEPFFTTKEVGKGTGLGLSQVFGFAKQSGGDVDVASTPGRGTTFTLYLPQEAIGTEAGREVEEEALAPVGRGQRVLVVEDNVEVGRFCTQILEDLGYTTTWAPNAEDALARLGTDGGGFDAVFSDVVMPGMGGIALAEELHRRLPDMPVVLASGYSQVLAQDGTHGFELLHKPYSAEQLSKVLRRVTGRRRRTRAI